MNINKVGLGVVFVFSAWCIHGALTTGPWSAYMLPATIAVLLGGVFAYNLGHSQE